MALYWPEQRGTPDLQQDLKRQCFGSGDGTISIPLACATGELRLGLVLFGVLERPSLYVRRFPGVCLPPRKTKAR